MYIGLIYISVLRQELELSKLSRTPEYSIHVLIYLTVRFDTAAERSYPADYCVQASFKSAHSSGEALALLAHGLHY